ncbi:MAG: DMT family transporter, partial [Mailhella sp.]|nr:DMT family transporter [Mailhella sp.]
LVLEVVGALVIIDPLHTSLDMRGVALVLLSAATFALYAVLGKKLCARYSGLAVTSFSCVAASVEMLLIMAVSHAAPVAEALRAAGLPFFAEIPFMQGYTSGNILTVLYICIFVTGGGYACYFMGMERTSPMQGSLVFFFKPILAPLLAMFILGESISWNMWCGIGLILAASLISMLPTIQTLNGIRHLHFPHRKK